MVSPRSKSQYRRRTFKTAGENMKSNIQKLKSLGCQAGGFYMRGRNIIVIGDPVFQRFMNRYSQHLLEDPEFILRDAIVSEDLPACPDLATISINDAKKHLTACLTIIQGRRPEYIQANKPRWWHLERYDSINKAGFKRPEVISLIERLHQHYRNLPDGLDAPGSPHNAMEVDVPDHDNDAPAALEQHIDAAEGIAQGDAVVVTRADEANHAVDLHDLQPASVPTPEESPDSPAWLEPVAPRTSPDTIIGPPAPTAVFVTPDQRDNSAGPSAPTTSLDIEPAATNAVASASTATVSAENSNPQPQSYVARARIRFSTRRKPRNLADKQ